MRFLYFISNYIFFGFLVTSLEMLFPSITSVEEYQRYGQKFVSLNFKPFELPMPSFINLELLGSILLTTYSYVTKKDIDKKVLFSRKGILISASLLILLFLLPVFLEPSVSNRVKFIKQTYNSLQENNKDKIIFPIPEGETQESFANRLNNALKNNINLESDKWDDECYWTLDAKGTTGLHYGTKGFLIINKDQIQKTIEIYNTEYSMDIPRCEFYKNKNEQKVKEAAKRSSRAEQERLRNYADKICDIANQTQTGC